MNFTNIFAHDDLGNVYNGSMEKLSDRIRLTIPKLNIPKDAKELYAFDNCFTAKVGEDGFFMGGKDFSRYSGFKTFFKKRADFRYTSYFKAVSMLGVKNSIGTFIAVPTGMRYDWQILLYKENDTYHIGLYYNLEKFEIYEDIVIDIFMLPENASHVDMAKRYRTYMLEEYGCVPIKERVKTQKELAYCVEAPEIRIRMGWKPAPPEVLEQTVENEPEMYVALTFERVKDIVDALKQEGVEKAELCLVGWNKSGHDGRWPDAFPVEESLGGEEALRDLIEYTQKNGYQIVCHTNSTDCYHISEKWDGGDIAAKGKNGKPITTASWSGGTMYDICPKHAYEHAKEILPKTADLGFRGLHYIDVISIVPPRICFDEKHPVNSRESVEYYNKIALLAKEKFGGFSSEGHFDAYMNVLDSCLYARFNRTVEHMFDEGVNLYEIISHGIVLSTPATNVVNYPIKTPEDRLQLFEHADRPSFYYYSKFRSDGSWLGNEDLICDSDEDLKRSAGIIAKGCKEYAELSYLQYEFIENIEEIAEGVFVTEFSDGSKLYANHNQCITVLDDKTIIRAKEFLLKKPQ